MKNIFKLSVAIIVIFVLSGCTKKIDRLSYTTFNEYFSKNKEYSINDTSNQYDINVRRYIEAGDGNIQVYYIEFSDSKKADEHIKNIFLIDKSNKIKRKKDYVYIKNTKGKYMQLYQTDNVIVIGLTNNKKYKSQVKKVLKDLGY